MKRLGEKEIACCKKKETIIAIIVRHFLICSFGLGFPALAQDVIGSAKEDTGKASAMKFNPGFIHGLSVDVARYADGNPNPEGVFNVQLMVNGERRGQHEIQFKPVPGSHSAQPCFKETQLRQIGIKLSDDSTVNEDDIPEKEIHCQPIDGWITGARADYTASDFILNLTIPQAYVMKLPRGWTSPDSWDVGDMAGLLDYNANFYTQQSKNSDSGDYDHSVNGNISAQAGLNLGEWRFRKRINSNWSDDNSLQTDNQYTYLQRDVPVLKGQLTLGDSVTSGDLFDSLNLRGIQLQSDDRMLPEGLRFYSPMLRGIAETNAKVRVSQRGQTVYETTVPPGPFELSDIGVMSFGGDVQLTITEADGRVRTQFIPYSSPPMLLHDGVARYGLAVGKVRDDSLREKPGLAQGFYQYGLGNMYTLYGGGQLSEHYHAFGIGNAFNTFLGGVSIDITHARSELQDGKVSSGNSYNVGFSKYFSPTDTDVMLAAYRYSSKGFYSLRDATSERYGRTNDDFVIDYRVKERLTLNIGQPVWDRGRMNFTGSSFSYWDERGNASQYSLTYNQSERYFSWSLSATRSFNENGKNINSVMLSFSVPLGHSSIVEKPLFSTLYSSLSHDNDHNTMFQSNIIGSQGEQSELTYGVGTQVSRAKDNGTQTAFNANANYDSSFGQFGSTASVGNRVKQLSFSANGSVVGHRGGLTLGPHLGDYPLALVHAPGAEGARMINGYGSRVDSHGYAVVPSLMPYRENTIALDVKGLPDSVDVLQSESTIIPRMGAVIPVNMKTQVGTPVVLIVRDIKQGFLPIGTEVFDSQGSSTGIIGQGGMVFIRGWDALHNLTVKDTSGSQMCSIYGNNNIATKITHANGKITQVEVICH